MMSPTEYRESRKFLFKVVRERYEELLGAKMDLKSRKHEQVVHRMALANSLRPFLTCQGIGDMLSKDHSSIVHYQKEHHPLLKHSAYYREQFRRSLQIVDEVSTEMDLHPNILGRSGANVDGQVQAIADIILDLENLLDRMLINRENARAIWKRRLEAIHLPTRDTNPAGGLSKDKKRNSIHSK